MLVLSRLVVLSTDSTIDTTDLEVGTVSQSNPTSFTVNVPASLVSSTSSAPVRYYIGLLPRSSSSSSSSMIVLPANSLLNSISIGSSSGTSLTLSSTNTQSFYSFSACLSLTKLTIGVYQVSGGLDPIINLYNISSSISAAGSDINTNGPNNLEFASYTFSGSGSCYTGLARVARNGSTTGTAKIGLIGGANTFYMPTFSGPSCTGGTGIYANRCADYNSDHLNPPTSSANCITLQGAGSTYSASTCSSSNRVGRCNLNPLSNDGRIILGFYSTAGDSASSAETACSGDIFRP
jgi:hypothetical protein